jgi:hypothetical protein
MASSMGSPRCVVALFSPHSVQYLYTPHSNYIISPLSDLRALCKISCRNPKVSKERNINVFWQWHSLSMREEVIMERVRNLVMIYSQSELGAIELGPPCSLLFFFPRHINIGKACGRDLISFFFIANNAYKIGRCFLQSEDINTCGK